MLRCFLVLILLLAVSAPHVPSAQAAVEWRLGKLTNLPGKPLDLKVSADGRRTFVLLEEGKIAVLDDKGAMESLLETGMKAQRLEISRDGTQLFLTDPTTAAVQTIELDFIYNIPIQGAPFKGPENAPVTIVLFSEFQCPYCAKLEPLLDQVRVRYPEQVKIVFKHYPLRSHQYARHAALAAMAAHKQGKFWPFHDQLFANQQDLSPQTVKNLAVGLGLDLALFDRDIRSAETAEQVNRDIADAQDAGVRGTPTVFINGRLLSERTLEGFSKAIDQELKNH